MPTHIDLGNIDSTSTPIPPDDDYVVTGGVGDHTLTLGNGTDQVTLGDGNNTLTVGNGRDQFALGNGNNTVTTGNGNSKVTVGNGNDTITVGTGSNTIALGTGVDTVHTGAGGNVVSVSAAAVSSDTIMGALTSGDGTTNQLVLTTAGQMSPINVSGFQTYFLGNGGANNLSLVASNFARLPGASITVVGGDSGNTINASSLSAAYSVTIDAGGGLDAFSSGAGNDRFVFAPSNLSGDTVNGGTGNNTVELTAGGVGVLNGLGTAFVNISSVVLDANATWTIGFNNTAAFAGTIFGFGSGDALDLSNVTYDSGGGAVLLTNNLLQVTEGGLNYTIQLDTKQNFVGDYFHASVAGSGTLITVNNTPPCFARGTQILTPGGEVGVERLTVGDSILTLDGKAVPIVWIGMGRVAVTPGHRNAATPVIVCKGALADNVPCRDLHLTKGHSLFIDDVLIPVEYLVNHRSIIWDDRARHIEIYHIELAQHDVLLADGAAAESYRDDGNRWLFENTNAGWYLLPQPPCAAVLTGGAIVDAAWRRLLDRAGPRPGLPITNEPDLHLLVDGQRLDSHTMSGDVHVFHLPRHPNSVRIVSRAGIPTELGVSRDERSLGVALRQIELRQDTGLHRLEASDASLEEGFHLFEPVDAHRWTNGDALLPAALFDDVPGGCELALHVGCTARYLDEGTAHAVAA